VKILIIEIWELIVYTCSFVVANLIPIIILASIVLTFFYVPGPHEKYKSKVTDIGVFAGYWISLGIASSIGLGTGLHTFVLYLGPHIATVTLAANECNYVPEHIPNRWRFTHFE